MRMAAAQFAIKWRKSSNSNWRKSGCDCSWDSSNKKHHLNADINIKFIILANINWVISSSQHVGRLNEISFYAERMVVADCGAEGPGV